MEEHKNAKSGSLTMAEALIQLQQSGWIGISGTITEDEFQALTKLPRETHKDGPDILTLSFTWPEGERMDIALVKTSLHAEKQKIGRKPLPAQRSLFDRLDEEARKEATEYGVEVSGIDITEAQTKALFAIQTLLNKTNYKGNLPGRNLDKTGAFRFEGYLPARVAV